jgi:DNA invertase Pin-like site-specific DNA recombinase
MATKRAAVYLRVSSEEQIAGYSLGAQERAAEALCRQHGWEIVATYRDEGKSARSDDAVKRPGFRRLMADCEARRFDVVIVHKLDRFARNRRVAFDAFHRLGTAGVGFVSIAENMDYSTPAGQLMLTMLVGLAQFYSDNLSWETKKGKCERKARGLYNGLLPFGTTKGPQGLPVLDTTAWGCDVATRSEIVPAEGLRLAFELAVVGKSDREIARALNDAGYRTSGNRGHNPFTKDSVRTILTNRFYVGELPDGQGGWVPGKHDALIDPALLERAQSARAANTSRPRWVESKRQPWALSGVAICGGCGANVNALSHSTGRRRIRCAGRTQGNGCDEPSCYADVIEDQIGELLAGFAVPEDQRRRLLVAWRYYQSRDTDTAAERIRLRRRLDRLKELYLDGEMDRPEYQAERATVADKLAVLPPTGNPNSDAGERLAAFLADVASAWRVATPTERNKLARQLFASVVVSNRTAVAVVPRPDLRPFFFALPRPEGVNLDGKECIGGSDGDRTRTFKTFRMGNVGFRSWTSDSVPQPAPAGHRSVRPPHPCGIGPALAG